MILELVRPIALRVAGLSAGMLSAAGQVQCDGKVVHLAVHRLTDLSADLANIVLISTQN